MSGIVEIIGHHFVQSHLRTRITSSCTKSAIANGFACVYRIPLGSVAVSTTITITTNTTITAISGATAIKATVRAGEENWERADVRRFRFYPRKSLKFLPYPPPPPPPTTRKKSILPFTLLFAKGTNGRLI